MTSWRASLAASRKGRSTHSGNAINRTKGHHDQGLCVLDTQQRPGTNRAGGIGLDYELQPVNVRKGEQKLPAYLALNPNGKVPVIVDPDGPGGQPFVLTESGAILVYLAEKAGRLIPSDVFGRARVLEQMFFHVTGIGPALGQVGFFKRQASEQIPFAIARFQAEAERTLAVLDGVLSRSEFAAGDTFTIADITHFGWLWRREFAGVDFNDTPNVARWYDAIAARPAVIRAIERLAALVPAA